MWTALKVLAVATAWGVWGAVGAFAHSHREHVKIWSDDMHWASLWLAPLLTPYFVTCWALWRLSEDGRYTIERRKMSYREGIEDRRIEHREEMESMFDRMLEDSRE